jgi:lipopolysaccharide exporter
MTKATVSGIFRYVRNLVGDINVKGDLFASAICFFAVGLIKLTSSVILTRLLYPEAYGVVAILGTVLFTVEMLSDIGTLGFMIRDKNGDDPSYIQTVWTLRLARSALNFAVSFLAAPLVATIYGAPQLEGAVKLISLCFLVGGLESMSFTLALRHRTVRLVSYSELGCSVVTTLFVLCFSYYSRDEWGMVYGMLLNRTLMTVTSYAFYRDIKLRLRIDKVAARDLFRFSKYVIPSSMIGLIYSQFDRLIFLKLFNLHLLGLYGVAGAIAGPCDALNMQINRSILFARCSHNWRTDRESITMKYYTENVKLLAFTMFFPPAIAGASDLIVRLLYDSRYIAAGAILQAFMLRSVLLSFASPAENVLVACGGSRVVLACSGFRLVAIISASLLGYQISGFRGFLYGVALSELPATVYLLWLQNQQRLMIAKFEFVKFGYVAAVFMASFIVSNQLSTYLPSHGPIHIHSSPEQR